MTYRFDDWKAGSALPKGWDCADAIDDGWTREQIEAFMRATVRPWSPPAEPTPLPVKQKPRVEARTTQQEKPEVATVTDIKTRVTYPADEEWKRDFIYDDKGHPKPSAITNWVLTLQFHPETEGVFRYDTFTQRTMLMKRPPWGKKTNHWTPRPLNDWDLAETVLWLEQQNLTPKYSSIHPVVEAVARRCQFDRLEDYLSGLEWDGMHRIETWLTKYLGVVDTPYTRTVARCWLVSSVARGLKPGCKVDTMPILEGPQGARKSTALRVLYGDEFFTDELSDINGKDALMELQGIWGLEVAEMHRFNAAETNAVKKFLSRQIDRFRWSHGKTVQDYPRRAVLCGTINPEGNGYLRDPTGARRFWPLEVGKIDVDGLGRNRDQLWAEAVHLFRNGASWWISDEEMPDVVAEQEKRTDVDVWTAIVANLAKDTRRLTQIEILEAIGVPKQFADHRHAARIGRIMKRLGWTPRRDRSGGGDQIVFEAPSSAMQEMTGW